MRVALLLLLAACGRFGFDANGDSGNGSDAEGDASNVLVDALAPDGVASSACTATRVGNVTLDAPVTNVVAAKTPGGYSLGFLTGTSSFLHGVFVNDSLVPDTDTPHQTSPVSGFTFTYTNASVFWTGSVLVGATSVFEDGNCYKKIYPKSMELYTFADAGQQCRIGDQSVAIAGTTVLSTWFEDDEHFFMALAADGMPQNPEMSGGVVGATIDNTSVASGITAVIATTLAGGCEARQIPAARGQQLTPGACRRPHIVNAGEEDQWLVTYEDNANIGVRSLRYVGANQDLMIGPHADLGLGAAPRLFRSTGGWLVAIDNSGLTIQDIDPFGAVSISGLPIATLDAFDVAGDTVFAAYGQDLYAIRCN